MFRPVPPDESGQDRSLGLPEQQGRRLKRAGIARKKGMAPPCPSALRRSTRSTAASGSIRSEEHTSELQSLMRISYAVFCLKKKKNSTQHTTKSRQTRRRPHQKPTTPTITYK